jgi:hypothetical protein
MDQLKIGDIIFVSQAVSKTANWFTKIIKCCMHSDITHCAIVTSTQDSVITLIHAYYGNGVCFIAWDDFIDLYYHCDIYVYHLPNRLNRQEIGNVLSDFIEKYKGAKYDDNVFHMLHANFENNNGGKSYTNEFFCSALCSLFLQTLQLLDVDLNFNLISPPELFDYCGQNILFFKK